MNSSAPSARIVFFGDSITEAGVKPSGYVTLIRDSLTRMMPDRSIEVFGAGVSGNKVPDLQARFQRDVLALDPTHVVIYIGINDVWHFFEFDEVTGTEIEAYDQGLRDLINAIHEAGAEASLCTPTVIGEDPDSRTAVNQTLVEYAERSRVVARAEGAHLCDLRKAFEDYLRTNNPGKRHEGVLTTDGVHLNGRGNRFVARQLLDHLKPFVESQSVRQ